MNPDYLPLKGLVDLHGYKVLEALWVHQVGKVEEARDKAALRGNESAWRYYAGQEKGFKLAMTALQRALLEMEKAGAAPEKTAVDLLMEELKK